MKEPLSLALLMERQNTSTARTSTSDKSKSRISDHFRILSSLYIIHLGCNKLVGKWRIHRSRCLRCFTRTVGEILDFCTPTRSYELRQIRSTIVILGYNGWWIKNDSLCKNKIGCDYVAYVFVIRFFQTNLFGTEIRSGTKDAQKML